MEKLNIEYLNIRADLLYEQTDDEFLSWLVCDDCVVEDYTSLIKVLEDHDMFERILMVQNYITSFSL